MRKVIVLALALTTLAIAGCGTSEDSADVNQDRIYTDYEVFYNANEDKTHVIARFRFGHALGSILELKDSSGASVSYNGAKLAYSKFWGGHHREYAGNTVAGGSFVYTDTNGKRYSNTVPSGTSIGFPSGFDTIDKNTAQTLAWVGTFLAPNDQVGIFVGSWAWGDDALFWTDADGAIDIVFGVDQMRNLALGTAEVFMDRWNAVNVAQGTSAGGRMRYKYRATNAVVTVIDSSPP
ncbi:MAG: hypothetical protein OEU50_01520 [Gammaproteobacteria bacterium]|nr:hypothetical protein [Gammaproteobacteria bacterium]